MGLFPKRRKSAIYTPLFHHIFHLSGARSAPAKAFEAAFVNAHVLAPLCNLYGWSGSHR